MKPIVYSGHALEQMRDRGATREEVEEAIRTGEELPAKVGRLAFRKNFPFRGEWQGKLYEVKQVMPIVVEEPSGIIVVTAYTFYFGGEG